MEVNTGVALSFCYNKKTFFVFYLYISNTTMGLYVK